MEIIKSWIRRRIPSLIGFEDEVVINYAIGELEQISPSNPIDPKNMQINLTGFLEDKTEVFMKELWQLLIEAQASPKGIVYI